MAKTPRISPSLSSINKSDMNPVGMIVQSILTEAQFQALNGTGWVLMDGRNIAGSQYATITGTSALPDARGMFLRGKNNGRSDGNQNPDGEKNLGEFTTDAIRNIAGNGWYPPTSFTPDGVLFFDTGSNGQGDIARGSNNGRTLRFDASRVVPTANDNRPKNLTVNIFIKINP